jgi:hypothetical protein
LIRVQAVVLPILRSALNAHLVEEGSEAPVYDRSRTGVAVVSVVPDVGHRTLPMIVVRRAGGTRHIDLPNRFSLPEVKMTAVSTDGLIEAEELYDDAIEALYAAVANQTVVPNVGHLQSIPEAQEPTQAPAEVPDTWAVTGSLRVGLRTGV